MALSVLCATLALPIINLAVDPTEVFDTGVLPHQFQVNDRYRKFDYVLNHCGDCSGFLLGSSRAGYIDPRLFNSLLPRGRIYNMNISSGNAWDYLEFARYLKRKGSSRLSMWCSSILPTCSATVSAISTIQTFPENPGSVSISRIFSPSSITAG